VRASGPASAAAEVCLPAGLIDEALGQLRTWGWHRGIEQLRQRYLAEGPSGEVELLLAWLGGDRARLPEARKHFGSLAEFPRLAAWATLGQAYLKLRDYTFAPVDPLLDEAFAFLGGSGLAVGGDEASPTTATTG